MSNAAPHAADNAAFRLAAAFLRPAPLDALGDIFLQLGRHYNTNSNQIVVLQGALDEQRLRQAVHTAVAQFPALLKRLDRPDQCWRPSDFAVQGVDVDGDCDFAHPAFRATLMQLSERAPIDWRHQPATQVFLLRSSDRRRCCVYLNSAHAAADAHSDGMLLEQIMRAYADRASDSPPLSHAFEPLQVAAPQWFTPLARIQRSLRAMADVAAANLCQDHAYPVHAASRFGYAPQHAQADFFSSVLPDDLMAQVRRVAKRHGASINTFFCAALVRTMEQRGAVKAGWLRLSCAVSLRHLPALNSPQRQSAFGNHILSCAVRQAAGRDGVTLLSELQASVKRARTNRLQVEIGRLELALPYMRLSLLQPLVRRLMARAQATNVCYSNPGVIDADFSSFGSTAHPVLQYTGLGCLVSPYDLMLYTTTVNGHTQLDALYRKACFLDIESELIAPLRSQIDRLLDELSSAEPAALATHRRAA